MSLGLQCSIKEFTPLTLKGTTTQKCIFPATKISSTAYAEILK